MHGIPASPRTPALRRLSRPAFSWVCLVLLLAVLSQSACVRRTLTIRTEPQGARVYVNDQEVGRTPVSIDFVWYGDYDIVIRKEGYETLKTNYVTVRPWYQYVPLDFFVEVLWPGWIIDRHEAAFVLAEQQEPDRPALIERALSTRSEALQPASPLGND